MEYNYEIIFDSVAGKWRCCWKNQVHRL